MLPQLKYKKNTKITLNASFNFSLFHRKMKIWYNSQRRPTMKNIKGLMINNQLIRADFAPQVQGRQRDQALQERGLLEYLNQLL